MSRVRRRLLLRLLVVVHFQKVGRLFVGRHVALAFGVVLALNLFLIRLGEFHVLPAARVLLVAAAALLGHVSEFWVLAAALLGQPTLAHLRLAPLADRVPLLAVALFSVARREALVGFWTAGFKVA